MRTLLVLGLVGVFPTAALAGDLTGTYVEARTASVFAGACHYNGELDTAGRKATMAFHIESGIHDGVDLSGVNVVVSVAANKNLDYKDAPRLSVVYVDTSATKAQQTAAVDAVRRHCASVIGKVVGVKAVPVSFDRTKKGFAVRAGKEVSLVVHELPDRACCNMPSNVWYKPFTKLSGRLVGRTVEYRVSETKLPTNWMRSDENGAFYGRFTLPGAEQLASN